MDNLEKYISILHEKGAFDAGIISPSEIIVAPWTIMKCRYGCSRYGHNRSCPPYAPGYKETREILDSFSRAIIFGVRSMHSGTPLAIELARILARDGYYKAIPFGTGPCTLCEQCTPQNCPNPEKTAPSMEACGIDVIATVRAAGYSITPTPTADEPLSCYGLILVD